MKMSKARLAIVMILVISWVSMFAGCRNEPEPEPEPDWYTIIFDSNGAGGAVPASKTVESGFSINLPDKENMTLASATLTGWNTKADGTGTTHAVNATYTPSGNIAAITLYAIWDILPLSSVTGLDNKLAWLAAHAQSNTSYTFEINTDESIAPHSLSYGERSGITITLRGVDTNRNIGLSSNNSMFSVWDGITLILDNNITLQGRNDNLAALVTVYSGGTLRMNEGSTITGNKASSTLSGFYGGGVYVRGGTFTMSGGTISSNSRTYGGGGGVYVSDDGTFTMSGGTITGNNVTYSNSYGGGVYVGTGTFTMSGGTIIGNNVSSPYNSYGGGVYVSDAGTFTMSGGTIGGNTTNSGDNSGNNTSLRNSYGGGVCVSKHGIFTMHGGTISDNTAQSISYFTPSNSYGGGVYVGEHGIFTMHGGTISDNTARSDSISAPSSHGGGVYVDIGTFTMSGGIISGNTASQKGGGLFVNSGTFSKTNGTIYGYNANDTMNSNVIKDSSGNVVINQGHAVYVTGGDSTKRMETTTAGPTVNLSFNGSNGNFSGAWEY